MNKGLFFFSCGLASFLALVMGCQDAHAGACDSGNASISVTAPATQSLTLFSNQTDKIVPFTVSVTQTTPEAGKCYLTFSNGLYGTSATTRKLTSTGTPGDEITYKLTNNDSNNILKDVDSATSQNDVIVLTFDGSQATQTSPVVWTIPSGQKAPYSTSNYTDSVTIDLYAGDTPNSSNASQNSTTLSLASVVPSEIYATLSPASRQATGNVFAPQSAVVDFGDFVQNICSEQTLDLKILSTNGYRVTITSENSGKMQLQSSALVAASTVISTRNLMTAVPYALEVTQSGTTTEIPLTTNTLSNPQTIDSPSATTFVDNDTLKMNFRLGDIPSNLEAGDYLDMLTVIVASAG